MCRSSLHPQPTPKPANYWQLGQIGIQIPGKTVKHIILWHIQGNESHGSAWVRNPRHDITFKIVNSKVATILQYWNYLFLLFTCKTKWGLSLTLNLLCQHEGFSPSTSQTPKQTWSFQMCSLSLEISSTVSPINAISMFKRRTKVRTTKVMRSRRNRTGYLEFCWISRSPSPRVSLKRSIRTGPRLLLEWHSPPSWHVSIRAARAEKKAQGNLCHNYYLRIQGISSQRIQTA